MPILLVEDNELSRDMHSRRLEHEGYTHAMEGEETKAREAGGGDHDTNPLELPRLLEKMEALPNP